MWLDDSTNPVWELKMYDGSDWISLISIDSSANQSSAYLSGIIASLGTVAALDAGTGEGQVPTNGDLGALAYLNTLGGANLASGSITTAVLAGLSVTTAKLGNLSVTTPKLGERVVTLDKLAAGTPGSLLGFNENGLPSLIPASAGIAPAIFTESGVWTKPTSFKGMVKITVVGSGGGRAEGVAGSTSSFGSHCSATGGGVGSLSQRAANTGGITHFASGGAGGVGVNGDLNIRGGAGALSAIRGAGQFGGAALHDVFGGAGGESSFEGSAGSGTVAAAGTAVGTIHRPVRGAGGAGGTAIKWVDIDTLAATETVTVGTNNTNGIVIVECL